MVGPAASLGDSPGKPRGDLSRSEDLQGVQASAWQGSPREWKTSGGDMAGADTEMSVRLGKRGLLDLGFPGTGEASLAVRAQAVTSASPGVFCQ